MPKGSKMAKPRENTFGIEFEEILCFYRYSWPHYQIFLIDLGFWNFSQKNSDFKTTAPKENGRHKKI